MKRAFSKREGRGGDVEWHAREKKMERRDKQSGRETDRLTDIHSGLGSGSANFVTQF